MTTYDELSRQDDFGQIDSTHSHTSPDYSYRDFTESLKKPPPALPGLEIEKPHTNINSKADYPQGMDSSEKICIETDNRDSKAGETKESTKKMGKDAPINLMEQFKELSQKEQEYAMSCIADFRAKTEPSALDQLKTTYIKFPEDQKTTVDAVLAHLKPQLKDYVVSFGAKEDSIYLDDLREVEPLTTKMYQAFYRAHKRDNSEPLLSDLIPKQNQKIDNRLEKFKLTDQLTYKEHKQNLSAINRRSRKNNNSSIAEPA